MSDVRDEGLAPELCIDGAVATICLRRPGQLNRLHSADLIRIQQHCKAIDSQHDVRVVVLTANTAGQSRPVFSAGYDIAGFDVQAHDPRLFEHTVDAVALLRPVVIAGLNGSVYGGATDLVLACDLRIGLPDLSWRMPACALGLHYYPSGLRRHVDVFGSQRTRQLFLTADSVTSGQLHQWGVLMELVAAEVWPQRLAALAQQVAQHAPLAAQGTKASIREVAASTAHEAVLLERERLCAVSEDFREGRQAMTERRPPVFKGR